MQYQTGLAPAGRSRGGGSILRRLAHLGALAIIPMTVGLPAWAQEPESDPKPTESSEAASTEARGVEDVADREESEGSESKAVEDSKAADPAVVTGDHSVWPTGFTPADNTHGNEDSPIKPSGEVTRGEPVPASGATDSDPGEAAENTEEERWTVELHGYAFADLFVRVPDDGTYDMTFRVRELELDVYAHRPNGGVRFDINAGVDADLTSFTTDDGDDFLLQQLVEQAYGEWTPGSFSLRGGKMNAPFGAEALDVSERLNLSRSRTSILTTPDTMTGFMVGYSDFIEGFDAYVIAVNGWDVVRDNNRSKTFGGGIPHHFGERSDGTHTFAGNLSVLGGAERSGSEDLRWLLDYHAALRIGKALKVDLEIAYGREEGAGLDSTGVPSRTRDAQWLGVQGIFVVDGAALGKGHWAKLTGGARVEVVHDPDLVLGLPAIRLPAGITTLVGVAPVLRFALVPGIELAAEYKVEFERNDNFASTQVEDTFVTHEVVGALVGTF